MNKTLMLGAVLALMVAGAPAIAADMPVKAPPVPMPMPAMSTWTGFYSYNLRILTHAAEFGLRYKF